MSACSHVHLSLLLSLIELKSLKDYFCVENNLKKIFLFQNNIKMSFEAIKSHFKSIFNEIKNLHLTTNFDQGAGKGQKLSDQKNFFTT